MEEQQFADKPKIYQALGIISGILELTEDRYSNLLIGEQTYFATVSPKVRGKHQPGQLQNFKIYPAIRERELGFSLRLVTQKVPRESGIILKGSWEIYEEESKLVIHRNARTRRSTPTAFSLIWKEAPVADGQYWEIEAKLKGDKFEVTKAIGPFDSPRKYQKRVKKTYANAKSDLPRPILKGDKYTNAKTELPPRNLKSTKPTNIKSELPSPNLKSARTSIAELVPKAIAEGASVAIELPESEVIAASSSEPIAFNAIEATNIATEAIEAKEPIASNEIKAIAESPSESIAVIEPEETETSSVVAEAATPKKKKAVSKSPASKKLSKLLETAEPKKTKEKAKSSSSKKPMSLAGDSSAGAKGNQLFLGKQLPPGK